MSNLEEHDAEQASLTAACEAGTCGHNDCPVDRNPEATQPQARRRAECNACGSSAIYLNDVSAYWDEDKQEWALSDCDNPPAYCGDCEAEHKADDCLVPA